MCCSAPVGGRRVVLAKVIDLVSIEEVLRHLGLPHERLARAPTRSPFIDHPPRSVTSQISPETDLSPLFIPSVLRSIARRTRKPPFMQTRGLTLFHVSDALDPTARVESYSRSALQAAFESNEIPRPEGAVEGQVYAISLTSSQLLHSAQVPFLRCVDSSFRSVIAIDDDTQPARGLLFHPYPCPGSATRRQLVDDRGRMCTRTKRQPCTPKHQHAHMPTIRSEPHM
jgi:hypothetical protein